ncbi:predicted protein [Sclerotinia sclerotiorum 1980 UF-70]|uniref:Aminoglycoside phosphotransferase domain-containing protein n=2 Tax=Sclerotinia sclerotiorum (strain ATCC 18683 / 1980 / Ss-1) TaxID=665079 RepID=A0A1D9QKI1_SCLS1|nr:predicted protein [Sclerotinia sclerotiorum 1980 UF-70]APA15312.1 hypothetical protein sscle_14g100820 [Sclerotinia sclerotiorum 1980 UF-70]EDN93086.1 predicted protein [Sclerotinia sclerotiorum 1980 UF-70]
MADLSWDVHTASEEFLAQLCNKLVKEDKIIGGCFGGDRVVKLTDNVAAKFGFGVTASEAKTQEFAYQNVDPNIAHIPQVYRYFRWEDFGYLFMEYVPGQQLNELDLNENVDIIPRVTRIIEHLGKIQGSQIPGPIGGEMPEGYLWGDDGARTTFTCVADMEAWLNKRLAIRDKSIDISSHPLVLCHMDLCRRNMILKGDNTISLLDWGCSGFYPRYFEFATLSFMMPYDESYETPLIKATATLLDWTEDEKALISLLGLARAVALRYTL